MITTDSTGFVLPCPVPSSFLQGYITCALWSSTDEDGCPLDANHNREDLPDITVDAMLLECSAFLDLCAAQGLDPYAYDNHKDATGELSGHDFWLTRNGHGAGYWDRGLGELGDKLTTTAKSFGSSDLYEGDDGNLYVS